jgi:uncharacterized protein (TIGR02001 family)
MKKSLIALALVSAFAAPAFAEEAAPTPVHTFTGNVTLASDYVFRGISQSQRQPAIQGGFDYSHASGLYAGTWASNVAWVNTKDNNSMEWDFYAGYKGTFADDFSYDVGALKYYYPGSSTGNAGATPDTTELYASIGWKFITLKYNYSVSKYLFAWGDQSGTGKDNRGSGYIDLSANYDLGSGWGIQAHVGHQDVRNYSDASYTDWKLGVTKDVGFGVVGLAYTDTDANGCGSASGAYCFTGTGSSGKNVGKATGVLSFSKTF